MSLLTAIIYARVSTEEQAEQGRSIKDQISACKTEAEKRGFDKAIVFKDPGKSGQLPWDKRPGLKDAMIRCEKGDVGAFFVLDTDRLARNVTQHIAIRANLKRLKVELISLNQPILSDESPESNLIEMVTAAVNAYIPQVTGRKVALSMQKKVEEGWWPGWAPLGYVNVNKGTKDKPQNVVVPDKKTGPLVRQVFENYATALYSFEQLAEKMDQLGLKTKTGRELNKKRIAEILHNRFYVGEIPYKNKIYPGKHQSLITRSLFDQVQTISGHHNRHADRNRKHNLVLRGHIYCGICQSPLTATVNKRRDITYYHCGQLAKKHSNKNQNVTKKELEQQIQMLFNTISLPQHFIENVMTEVEKILHEVRGKQNAEVKLIKNKLADNEHKREILENKMLEGIVSDDTYVRQHDKLDKDIKSLNKEIFRLSDYREERMKALEQLLLMAKGIGNSYRHAKPEVKKMYLSTFWKRIEVKNKKVIRAEPVEDFGAVTGVKYLKYSKSTKKYLVKSREASSASASKVITTSKGSYIEQKNGYRGHTLHTQTQTKNCASNVIKNEYWLLGSDSNRQPADYM